MSPITAKLNASGWRECVAQPARRTSMLAAATRAKSFSVIGELLQAVKCGERVARREVIGVDRGERLSQRVLRGRGRGRGGGTATRGAEEIRLDRSRAQLLFQLGEVPARRAHDILRDTGEVRHVDAVRPIGGAAFEAMQEDDAV